LCREFQFLDEEDLHAGGEIITSDVTEIAVQSISSVQVYLIFFVSYFSSYSVESKVYLSLLYILRTIYSLQLNLGVINKAMLKV
jgi:hypothetical protein